MYPAIQIGPLVLPTGPLTIILSFWILLTVGAREATRKGLNGDHVYNAGFYGLLAGLLRILNAFLILLTVIFILLEAATFQSKLYSTFGTSKNSMSYFNSFTSNINRYMVIKTWMSLATGLLVAIWLAVLRVDYPVLWGLLAFIFNYVPNIGSIIAAIPAVLLAFIQLGTVHALLAAGGYIVFNIIIGNNLL